MLTVHNRLNKLQSYSLPSDKDIDLTLGASGSTYTAPANGWVHIDKTATATGQYIALINIMTKINEIKIAVQAGNTLTGYIPVSKDETIRVDYTSGGKTNQFRFYYAEGEV